jgi:translation initiation factor IF-3
LVPIVAKRWKPSFDGSLGHHSLKPWDNIYFIRPTFLLKNNSYSSNIKTRINHAIKAPELRVVGPDGENIGLLSLADALKAAESHNLDLIEISPNATPPVAKIMDYGKYRYQAGRKASEMKAKSHVTETKNVQVKIGTGENDQKLKASRAAEWLEEGHRVKVDLFLWGRYKYMDEAFLKERLDRFLRVIPTEYKVADDIKKSPKGYTITLERVPGSKGTYTAKIPKKPVVAEIEPKKAESEPVMKKKKKDLDDLLAGGMI